MKYCSICKVEYPDDQTVCPKCGLPLEDMAAQPPVTEAEPLAVETEQPAVEAVGEPIQPAGPEATAAPVIPAPPYPGTVSGEAVVQPVKKSHKGLIVACIVLAVLLVLAAVGYLLYPRILRAAYGEGSYYAIQESRTLGQYFGGYQDTISPVLNRDMAANGKLTVSANGTGLGTYADLLKNLSLEYTADRDASQKKAKYNVKLMDGTTEVFSTLIQSERGDTALSFFGESTQYLLNNLATQTTDENPIKAFTGMEAKEFGKYLTSYFETVMNSIPKENIATGSNVFDGTTFDTVTFTIDDKAVQAICAALAQKIESDPQLKSVLLSMVQYVRDNMESMAAMSNMDAASILTILPSEQDIDDLLAQTIEKLHDAKTSSIMEEASARYTVYYTSRGAIAARSLSFSENDVTVDVAVGLYSKDGQQRFVLEGKAFHQSVRLQVDYANTNNQLKGQASVLYNGDTLAKADFDLQKELAGGVPVYTGTAQFDISESGVAISAVIDMKRDGQTVTTNGSVTMSALGQNMQFALTDACTYSTNPHCEDVSVDHNSTARLDDKAGEKIGEKLGERLLSAPSFRSFLMSGYAAQMN